jgi:heterodisulfide reductase subunit C
MLRRVLDALSRILFQRCTLKNERLFTGFAHVLIFYGALTFDTMTINHTLEGFFPDFYLFGRGTFGDFFSLLTDSRCPRPRRRRLLRFRRFILAWLCATRLDSRSSMPPSFVTSVMSISKLLDRPSPGTERLFLGWPWPERRRNGMTPPRAYFKLAWWPTSFRLRFIAYVPHSIPPHVHGPFNVFFRAQRRGRSRLDLEKSEVFGVERTADFTWKDNLDAFACMECGRCQDACPAFASDKPLSPKMILFNQERALLAGDKALVGKTRDDLPELVPATFTEGEIWTCTTCGACQKECPVEIEHIRKIVGARRSQVLMQSKFPQELNAFFRNMETNANPWGLGFS